MLSSQLNPAATGKRKSTRSYSQRTLGLLWGLSGNQCAHPDCSNELIAGSTPHDAAAIIGHIAHIYGASDDGPRPNPALTPEQRDDYSNLILLCRHHHGLVDAQHCTYTADELLDWKRRHEEAQRALQIKAVQKNIGAVAFPELEAVASWLLATDLSSHTSDGDRLRAVPPPEKIAINELGENSRFLLKLGASKSPEVARFIAHNSQLDAEFGNRLRVGFVSRYRQLRAAGIRRDVLFDAMYAFTWGDSQVEARKAAGLAILTHLFMLCEVFETERDEAAA